LDCCEGIRGKIPGEKMERGKKHTRACGRLSRDSQWRKQDKMEMWRKMGDNPITTRKIKSIEFQRHITPNTVPLKQTSLDIENLFFGCKDWIIGT